MRKYKLHGWKDSIIEIPGRGTVFAAGDTPPTDGQRGYAKGCLFIQLDASGGVDVWYVNVGTRTSSDFDVLPSVAEMQTLDGLTASVSELNILDGVLATADEINRNTDRSTRQVAAGATLSLTEAAHDGKTIALDTAAGSVVTLPAPVIGMRVRFLVTVKPTSNFHQVKVAAGTDFLAGSVNILDNDASAQAAFAADGAADDNIQLNGTTKGGLVGDWLEIEGISATVWAITGQLVCPAGSNPADMFSAAV